MHPRELVGIQLVVIGAILLIAGIRMATAFFTGIYPGSFLAVCGALMMIGGAFVGRLPAAECVDMHEVRGTAPQQDE